MKEAQEWQGFRRVGRWMDGGGECPSI